MKKIPQKNYYILVVLVLVTIILTLSLASIYREKDKLVSNFYTYANKINNSDFDEYIIENSDLIIYISDKYDLSNESFEASFIKKIDELNLKSKLVFIDKSGIDKKFLNKIQKNYKIKININNIPIIIVVVDRKVVKSVYVTPNSNVDTIIEYEVFE